MNRMQMTAAAVLMVCAGGAIAGWKAHAPVSLTHSPVSIPGNTGWKPVPRELVQPEDTQPKGEPFVGI